MHKPLGKEKRHPRGNVRNILYLCGWVGGRQPPGENMRQARGNVEKKL